MKNNKGAAALGIISSVASGLALLIVSQLFSGVNKAQADVSKVQGDISSLREKETTDVELIKKEVQATRAGIEVLMDIQGKTRPEVMRYRVLYPNTTATK